MRFGLALPHYGFSFPDGGAPTFERVARAAVRAETLGFDSVWISDHFYLSIARYGGGEGLHAALEPITTLGALAARTSRVRLGTLVLSVSFRHPALLAKAAVTLDALSSGRFELGLGSGWYEPEFQDFGYGFPPTADRFRLLEETLEVVGALMSGEPVDHDGASFHLRAARMLPARRPPMPLWLGAKGGPRAMGIAARHADGWNTVWRWTPQAYGERARIADRACETAGRDPKTLRRSLGLYCLVGEDERDLVERYLALQRWMPNGALNGVLLEDWMRDTLSGTPERILESLSAFAGFGVEEIIISPAALPFAAFDDEMLDLFAEEIIPSGRAL